MHIYINIYTHHVENVLKIPQYLIDVRHTIGVCYDTNYRMQNEAIKDFHEFLHTVFLQTHKTFQIS